jgi:hypothetical protein
MRKKAAAQPFTSTGYAARRLAEMQAAVPSPRAWLTDTLWLGGLAAAAAVAWRALAAHPAAQLAVAGYLAVEALFYLWGRKRCECWQRLAALLGAGNTSPPAAGTWQLTAAGLGLDPLLLSPLPPCHRRLPAAPAGCAT